MKTLKLTLISLLLAFMSAAFGQDWTKNLPEEVPQQKLRLQDYQKAFNTYWEPYSVYKGVYVDQQGLERKAAGWKQFQRWNNTMEYQVDEQGNLPGAAAFEVYQEYLFENSPSGGAIQANWVSMGPDNSYSGYSGIGRINCIAFHPTDNDTYWVGAAAGGVWVTQDNGASWNCLTDQNPVLGISDITIPPDFVSSQTIYIATGDRDHWDNRSVGVLKSTDSGNTWNTTGLSYQLSDGQMVTRLLVDPNDSQSLIAATTNGVYKTTDGGTTWNSRLTTTYFIDMEYKPGDFSTLYGSTTNGYILASSDGGQNWAVTLNTGQGRIELGVSPADPSTLYAISAASSSGLHGIFKSTNSGATFFQIFDGSISGNNLLGWSSDASGTGGQGWYDLSITISPTDIDRVLIGGINTWGSTDGGSNWDLLNFWYDLGNGIPTAHADKHMIRFRDNGDIFECNDGGIYLSEDNGTSFIDKTNGIVISQIYKIGIAQTLPNETVAGLQDNGTKLLSSNMWDDVLGGDGMDCMIDYTNPNIQYGSTQNGNLYRTDNHWYNSEYIKPPNAGSGAWVTPMIMDPVDPNTIYSGYSDVWKSTNRGDSWTKISDFDVSQALLRTLAIAPSDLAVLYASDFENLWKTTDGGTNWTDLTSGLPLWTNISSITIHNTDPDIVWITCGGFDSYRIYQSNNGGATWSDISQGLPMIPYYTIVQDKQITGEIYLYAGSESGVFFKEGNADWVPFNEGLPLVTTRELEIYYAENQNDSKLRLGTHGRGLWETELVPEQELTLTDIDGNIYQTVLIGDRRWMAENIRTTRFADGSAIPLVEDNEAWTQAYDTGKGYCWYDNDINNGDIYGALYSWGAATNAQGSSILNPSGIQGVCPDDWHLPSDYEWQQLELALGMDPELAITDGWRGTDEGGKLKEEGIDHWITPNIGATNESGFTALPAGHRNEVGEFYGLNNYTDFWTTTQNNIWEGAYRVLFYDRSDIGRFRVRHAGFSVRCVENFEVIYDGLIAHYPLESNGIDISGYNSPMTLANVTFENGGIYCNGIYADFGGGHTAITPMLNGFDEQSFTISAEFMLTDDAQQSGSPYPVFVCGERYRWAGFNHFYEGGEHKVNIYYNNTNFENTETVIPINQWNNAKLVYDGTTLMAFLNNELVFSKDLALNFSGDYNISTSNYTYGTAFKGYLKDLMVSNHRDFYLSATPGDISLSGETNSQGSFEITSNLDWDVIADESWLLLDPLSGSGDGTVGLTASANITGSPRTSVITISADAGLQQSILVTQEASSNCTLPPEWNVNPPDYAHNAQVTAQVIMNGTAMETGYLAAFVNGECRGFDQINYFPPQDHFVFELMCYSNQASAEVLEFKYFDDMTCAVIEPLEPTIEFIADMNVGDAVVPFEFTTCTDISYGFVPGWNWFSINSTSKDMTLANLLTCNTDGDYIKDQVSSSTYFADYGWFGNLDKLDSTRTYMIKVANACRLEYCGFPVNVANTSISVPQGWSWIGYLPQAPIPIGEALGSLSLENNDYIKTISSSATYYDDYGWYGLLEQMVPQEGYKFKKQSADVLTYSESASAIALQPATKNEPANSMQTGLNPHQFENSGSVTARVFLDGFHAGNQGDLVMAYVNGQYRGVVEARYFDPAKAYTFPLMVYSNLSEGEIITFKYYDASSDQLYACAEELEFRTDMIIADAFQPFDLNVNAALGLEEGICAGNFALEVYPNPFRDEIRIDYSLTKRTRVTITVYDLLGKIVEIVEEQTVDPGSHSVVWNAEGHPDATYILKISTDDASLMKRIIHSSQ